MAQTFSYRAAAQTVCAGRRFDHHPRYGKALAGFAYGSTVTDVGCLFRTNLEYSVGRRSGKVAKWQLRAHRAGLPKPGRTTRTCNQWCCLSGPGTMSRRFGRRCLTRNDSTQPETTVRGIERKISFRRPPWGRAPTRVDTGSSAHSLHFSTSSGNLHRVSPPFVQLA
jgi:hypothetical protein